MAVKFSGGEISLGRRGSATGFNTEHQGYLYRRLLACTSSDCDAGKVPAVRVHDHPAVDLIASYDGTLTRWYADHNMHPKDPRWSAMRAKRLPAVARRAEVADCLKMQGFFSPRDHAD